MTDRKYKLMQDLAEKAEHFYVAAMMRRERTWGRWFLMKASQLACWQFERLYRELHRERG